MASERAAGVAGAGAAPGLLLSRVILEVGDWGWLFAANTLWAALALALTLHVRPVGCVAETPLTVCGTIPRCS